jgi:hypothetical protein
MFLKINEFMKHCTVLLRVINKMENVQNLYHVIPLKAE